MKISKTLGVGLVSLVFFSAQAEEKIIDKATAFAKKYQIVLRESSIDKNALDKPARVQYIANQGGKDSYSIDVGVSGSVLENTDPSGKDFFLGPSIEYHKQTETKKEQENFQAGLTFIKQYGAPPDLANFYLGSLKYKHDRKTTGNGFIGRVDYSPVYAPWLLGRAGGWDLLQFMWQPSIGLQNEYGDKIKSTISTNSGHEIRLRAQMDIALYPLGAELQKRFELSASYIFWKTIAESGEFNNVGNDRKLFRAGATFYFNVDQNFGVGIEYRKGEDIENGLPKQESITASLTMKF